MNQVMSSSTHLSDESPVKNFEDFYQRIFIPEHQHKLTIATHVLGTWAGLGWLAMCIFLGGYWLALVLLFPVVHAVPGLIGHRLVERNEKVGDLRVSRKDFPLWWFIRANHRMTMQILMKGRLG
jgi:hypothetical protein